MPPLHLLGTEQIDQNTEQNTTKEHRQQMCQETPRLLRVPRGFELEMDNPVRERLTVLWYERTTVLELDLVH